MNHNSFYCDEKMQWLLISEAGMRYSWSWRRFNFFKCSNLEYHRGLTYFPHSELRKCYSLCIYILKANIMVNIKVIIDSDMDNIESKLFDADLLMFGNTQKEANKV